MLVSVWGKGGVGKSTVAAALSTLYASRGYRVALVSTDIFPSILEVVGRGEPGRWIDVCGFKLLAVSYDLARVEWRRRFGDQVYRVVSTLFDIDRETLLEYLETAPWVLEQLHMLIVVESLENNDIVVWDTAGAGGGLQALELEERLYRHLRLAPRIYSRILGRTKLDEVIEEWRRLAEKILTTLKSELHKPVIVTDVHSGAWPVYELTAYLERIRRPKHVVLNKVPAATGCPLCTRLAERAERVKKLLEKQGYTVYTLPFEADPPRGCESLTKLAEHLKPLAKQLEA